MPNDKIDVTVTGAVSSGGHHLLANPGTIRLALDAAGGLAGPSAEMRASGVVTVRRIKGHQEVDVFRFKMSDAAATWENFQLQGGDMVVFQWQVEVKPE